MNLSYNYDFIPNYNIFNINNSSIRGNIGINNHYPKSLLEINGLMSIKNNLIVSNSIYYNNNLSNINNDDIYILNKLNNKINISKLKLNNQNDNNKWVIENNKLVLKLNGVYNNSIIQYKSDIYDIGSNDIIKLLVNKHIIITHLLILNNSNSNISTIKIKKFNQNNVLENEITTVEIDSNTNTKLYKLNKPLLLTNYLNILQVEDINTNLGPNSRTQIFGKYIEEKGSLWLSNNNNVFINKKVNIFSNNNQNYELYINGNVSINNNIETNYLNSINLNIAKNFNISNTLKTLYIESNNSLNLGSIKLNIGNNDNINNHNIGKTNITNNGLFNIENITLNNNLNINNTIKHNISNTNLSLNTNDISLSYVLYSQYEKDQNLINSINPSHNTQILNISDTKTKINCKTYLGNNNIIISDNFKNTYNFGIFYNTNINGSLICNTDKITYKGYFNDINVITYNNINMYQNINIDESNTYEFNINRLQSNNIILEHNNNINYNIVGSIGLNLNNKLVGNNNNNFEFTLNNITNLVGINQVFINTIKLPQISNVYNNYTYNINNIGILRYNNTHFQLHDGNIWNNLNYDEITEKFVKIIKKYNPIISNNNYNTIIPPNNYYNIIFITTTKIRLIKTNIQNNKTFQIKFNKIYLNNNDNIQYSLHNIINENDNNYTADIVFDLHDNLLYVHMEIHDNLNGYYVLIKLSGYDNLYKLDPNHSSYNNTQKIYIKEFRVYTYDNIETPIYIINFKYDNTLNSYICSIFYSYNYQITILNQQTQFCKLEHTTVTNQNTFHVINYQLATSITNKTNIGLQNLLFDETNKYFTANIVSQYNNYLLDNTFYYIKGNTLINNKVYYTIKKKKHIINNIYEAHLVN